MTYQALYNCIGCLLLVFGCQSNKIKDNKINDVSEGTQASLFRVEDRSILKSERINDESEWENYCKGSFENIDVEIEPNYDHDLVSEAARNLDQIDSHSMVFFSQLLSKYKINAVPGAVKPETHTFLVYLCGEYRDRPSMIKAKLQWIANMNYLTKIANDSFDINKSPWVQMSLMDYKPFMDFTNRLYQARIQKTGKLKIVTYDINGTVPPQTICEIKFIFSQFVRKNITFPEIGLDGYELSFKSFLNKCSSDDLNYYSVFRGETFIHPNISESNGMIWHAHSLAMQCQNRTKAFGEGNIITYKNREWVQNILVNDGDCVNYFKNPFQSRWEANRSGLGSWMLRNTALDQYMKNASSKIIMKPDYKVNLNNRPIAFETHEGTQATFVKHWEKYWKQPSFGIQYLYNQSQLYDQYYQRLRDAINRHSNWSATAYRDGVNQGRDTEQAYTPLSSFSIDMSKSDQYVNCGGLIPCVGEDSGVYDARRYKHFIFVYKVKKERWYRAENIVLGQVPNFESDWFDERSLGTEQSTQSERALDRLGTALEEELDSILYLHNMCSNGEISEYFDGEGRLLCQ